MLTINQAKGLIHLTNDKWLTQKRKDLKKYKKAIPRDTSRECEKRITTIDAWINLITELLTELQE